VLVSVLFVRLELFVLLAQSLQLLARLTHSDIALQQESGELHVKGPHLAARVLQQRVSLGHIRTGWCNAILTKLAPV